MPQFPITPDRERILARIPDYAVEMQPHGGTVTVSVGDTVLARSTRALTVAETRHDNVYYIPRDDVNLELFEATELSTYCPFKGHASYWSLKSPEAVENVVWSYESPFPEVEPIRDYLSFYTNKVSISSN